MWLWDIEFAARFDTSFHWVGWCDWRPDFRDGGDAGSCGDLTRRDLTRRDLTRRELCLDKRRLPGRFVRRARLLPSPGILAAVLLVPLGLNLSAGLWTGILFPGMRLCGGTRNVPVRFGSRGSQQKYALTARERR